MARSLIKLTALSRAIGVSGIPDGNIGASNVFQCTVSSLGSDVAVIFDSTKNEPLRSVSLDDAIFYLDRLASTGAVEYDKSISFTSITSTDDLCQLAESSREVPITLIQMSDEIYFAVVASGPLSPLFTQKDVLSTFRVEKSNLIQLSVWKTSDKVDDSCACREKNEDRMLMNRVSEESWEFGLNSIGLLAMDANYTLLTQSVEKAIVATAFEGIGFPAVQYDQMISNLQSSGHAVVSDDPKVISNCFTDDAISKSLPDLVITFAGQNGYGIRIHPEDYVVRLENGQCRLLIQKVMSPALVLGDAFIKSGYVELNKAEKFMLACPNKQHHLTDDAFNANIPVHLRPAPRGIDNPVRPNNSVITVGELQQQDTSNNALIIGLTVGGVVLIIAAIVFFIIRKRKQLKKKHRFDPSRSMIHDPSEVSSVEESSIAATAVRV
jgi:hypothetical protein